MKRSIISLFVAGLFAGTATISLAQNVTAGEQPADPARGGTTEQKEMTNPSKDDVMNKSKHDKGDLAFKKADKDNDGTLDKAEAKAMPNVARHFDAIDTDKDGTVSLEEVHTYMKARHSASAN